MVVGGYADNVVDLCGEDNADAKRQCLGKGHTFLTKQPSQVEFEECWSESIINNRLSPSLVDDPLFRKTLVTTARLGQTVCVDKGTTLGKRDTTLPHRHTFSMKIIPSTDKRMDFFFIIPVTDKRRRSDGHNVFMSRWSVFHDPIHSTVFVIMDKQFCRREMDEGIKKDIWSVMEDFSKAPGDKDFIKMKSQYAMFVDVVVSKQVCVSIICMTLHCAQLSQTQLITLCVQNRFADEVKDDAHGAFTPK